jgi:hypothetical protein
LRDLIDWKVADINVGRKLGFEWGPDFSKLLPNYTAEERMLFDRRCAIMGTAFVTQSVLCVA